MPDPLRQGDAVVSYGHLGTVKDVRPHDPRKPYLVELPVGSLWTKHVARPPESCACDGSGPLYKTRHDVTAGVPPTAGAKRYNPQAPEVLRYAEALGHEDPYLFQRIQDQLTHLNQTEWRDPDRYFAGLTPEQLAAQHRDPHLMMLGSMAQQARDTVSSFRMPHEMLAQGIDLSLPTLARTPPEQIAPFISGGLQNTLAKQWHEYANHVMQHYGGDVRNIWADDPDYTTLRNRLSALNGLSDFKKVPMVADILRRWGKAGGGISGKGFEDTSHPVMDTHAIRMYSHLMTSDPNRRAWLQKYSSTANGLHALPYLFAFSRAVGRDPNLNHAPIWQMAQEHCKPGNEGGPQCQGCPLGASCATGMLRPEHREAMERYRGTAEEMIPRLSDEEMAADAEKKRATEQKKRQKQLVGV
jgi:hypothetical protein